MLMSPPRQAAGEDAVLLEKLRAGEGQALEAVARAHACRLTGMVQRLLQSQEEARAVVREALIALGHDSETGEINCPLGIWLVRKVLNSVLYRLRARQKITTRPIEELLPKFLDDGRQQAPAAEWSDC